LLKLITRNSFLFANDDDSKKEHRSECCIARWKR